MSIYNKAFFGCAVMMSSFLMISCSQSPETQSANSDNEQTDTTVTTNKPGPTVALSSENLSVYKGDTFTVDVLMSNFSTTEGGGISITFDANILQAVSVNVDESVWRFKNKNGVINNAEGSISDILFSSYKGVSGDARIATIEFKSIEKGSSGITLRTSPANVFASNGLEVPVTFNRTTVSSN